MFLSLPGNWLDDTDVKAEAPTPDDWFALIDKDDFRFPDLSACDDEATIPAAALTLSTLSSLL